MIVIEKHVPIPSVKRREGKYPLWQMEVGDSFFAPGMEPRTIGGSLGKAKKAGRNFTMRKAIENGVSGVRVWRTA